LHIDLTSPIKKEEAIKSPLPFFDTVTKLKRDIHFTSVISTMVFSGAMMKATLVPGKSP
jgi:hypothetical protein